MPGELTAELLVSVDGWAGSEGLPGFFGYLGPELEEWLAADSETPYIALMGRKTYETLAGLPDEAKDAEWEKMTQRETVVFSGTLNAVDWPNARVADDLVGETTGLKDSSVVPLRTVGSPSLVRQFLAEGLVDRLRLVTFPLFAGPDGREWGFKDFSSADLELVDHQILDGRVLVVDYRPTGRDIPRT